MKSANLWALWAFHSRLHSRTAESVPWRWIQPPLDHTIVPVTRRPMTKTSTEPIQPWFEEQRSGLVDFLTIFVEAYNCNLGSGHRNIHRKCGSRIPKCGSRNVDCGSGFYQMWIQKCGLWIRVFPNVDCGSGFSQTWIQKYGLIVDQELHWKNIATLLIYEQLTWSIPG